VPHATDIDGAPPRLHLLDELANQVSDDPLATLADAAPALLFACSSDGSEAWVSRQWLAYTGVADADTLKERWPEVTVPGDRSPLAHPDQEPEGACVETPFRLRDAKGEYRWQLARARPARDSEGQVLFWAGVVQELVPQPAPKADVADEAAEKDEFFALLSHELRSPLNAIRGWAHVLRSSGGLSPMQERALATIDRNVAAQARMIDDLLDRQRLLHGDAPLERQRVVLGELVAETVETMRPSADDKRIQLSVECADALMVDVDPQRLRQVLVNLLSNALRFTPPDGRVQVRALRTDTRAAIDVADTGIGLAPEWVLRAFSPGAPRSGTAPLGLGLALTQRIVELHGGRISASSEGPDRGSTFRVELPLTRVP
jgi:signal transduction histidine kinase